MAGADLFGALPSGIDDSLSRFALAAAIAGSFRLMLWTHSRPVAAAYEMGVEQGRREAMRAANRRAVSPIRRAPSGLADFNRTHGGRLNERKGGRLASEPEPVGNLLQG